MRALGIGDNVCDKYEHQKMMYPGGQALNFAVYASKLGAEAAFIGAFGSDAVADAVQAACRKFSVDISRARHYEGANGAARVTLVDGDRKFLGSNKGGVLREHPLELTDEDIEYIKGFDIVHTTNNSYMDAQLARLATAGVPISFDFSGQWRDEARVAAVAPHVDFAFLSVGDVPLDEAREIARSVYAAGVPMVTLTRGGEGALLFDGRVFYEQKPKFVEPVDTLGAGDSYATAFLLSLIAHERWDADAIKDASSRAAEFSSQTCLVYGAFGEGVPYDPSEDAEG